MYKSLVFCLFLLSAMASFGQSRSLMVNSINVEFIKPKTTSQALVLSNVSLKEGMVYSQAIVDQSIRELYRTGFFEFIEVRLEESEAKNTIDVVFVVQSKFRLDGVNFEGNEKLSDKKLKKQVTSLLDEPLNELQIKKDAEAIKEYYIKDGYSQVAVDYTIDRDLETGLATVTYSVNESGKIAIRKIVFEGNGPIKQKKLRKLLETKKRWWMSWLTGSGRLNEDEFSDDLDRVRAYLKEEGYLDSTIADEAVVYDYKTPEDLYITIPIELGRQYRFGEITVSGNTLFDNSAVLAAIGLQQGEVYRPSLVDDAKKGVRDLYGRKGYLDSFAVPQRQPDLETGEIGLEFKVREGDLTYVQSINIDGNTKTKNIVILRELALEPGDVFDLVRMENSERRLQNTRFFESVSLTPEGTTVPGRRDLRISVKEGRTGNVSFGAGFSSIESATVFVELTQGNFDLFNYRSMFQGDGQKFRIRAAVGTESNSFNLSFEEPWIFEREIAGGFELFRTESDFNSDDYSELRTGFELFLRKRLFELVTGRLAYRYEIVGINEVSEDSPEVIQAEEGDRSVSKVIFTLTRDDRNAFINTSDGSRVQWRNELAGTGLGGDTDYWKTELRTSRFWPIFDTGKQVFSVLGRGGVVTPLGDDDDVPFFDRFFLGGPNTLRGYDFREVGPVDADDDNEPIGGNSYALISLEYSFELFDPVRLAFFYDGGFVNPDEWDFDIDQYNDNVGVGLRILLFGNSPLSLDFAFPINAEEYNDSTMQFHFSFGARF